MKRVMSKIFVSVLALAMIVGIIGVQKVSAAPESVPKKYSHVDIEVNGAQFLVKEENAEGEFEATGTYDAIKEIKSVKIVSADYPEGIELVGIRKDDAEFGYVIGGEEYVDWNRSYYQPVKGKDWGDIRFGEVSSIEIEAELTNDEGDVYTHTFTFEGDEIRKFENACPGKDIYKGLDVTLTGSIEIEKQEPQPVKTKIAVKFVYIKADAPSVPCNFLTVTCGDDYPDAEFEIEVKPGDVINQEYIETLFAEKYTEPGFKELLKKFKRQVLFIGEQENVLSEADFYGSSYSLPKFENDKYEVPAEVPEVLLTYGMAYYRYNLTVVRRCGSEEISRTVYPVDNGKDFYIDDEVIYDGVSEDYIFDKIADHDYLTTDKDGKPCFNANWCADYTIYIDFDTTPQPPVEEEKKEEKPIVPDYIPVVLIEEKKEEVVEIIEEEVPEAPAEVEEEVEEVEEVVEEIEVEVPEIPEALPKTGTAPVELFFGIGSFFMTVGAAFVLFARRKN